MDKSVLYDIKYNRRELSMNFQRFKFEIKFIMKYFKNSNL